MPSHGSKELTGIAHLTGTWEVVPDCACPGQVCCRQKDYWQFVKDIRWLSPGSAHHLEKVGSGGVALCT